MANTPIREISLTGIPTGSSNIVFDDGQMKKGVVSDFADAVRPVASQAEAQAGVDNAKTMTALRVKQSVASEVGVTLASKAQGDLANSALQADDIGTSVQAYDVDLDALSGLTSAADRLPYFTGSGTAALADFTTFGRSLVDDTDASSARTTLGLGTAATTAATDYATAAQGATADSAVQPGDLGGLAVKDKISVPGDVTATGTPSSGTFLRGDGSWTAVPGGGDMLASTYDPTSVAADAFDPVNHPYTDGFDSFSTPMLTRSRNWMWITDTDQITGNGTSDDTVGVQSAIQKACENSRILLIPDNITIRLTAPVVNYNKLPLRMSGGGVEAYQENDYNAGGVNTRGPGSWFFLDHSGKGFEFTGRDNGSGTVGNTQIALKGIGTFRTQPPPASGWAPTDHDYDFDFTQCTADIDDLMFWNATRGLNWKRGRAGQLNIGTIRGQPLLTGIQIVNAYDVVRIRDMHFWRFWSLDANVASYMLASANAIISYRNDNPIFGNLFSFGYKRLLLVGNFAGNGSDEPAGTTYHASIDNLCSDFGESAITVASSADGFTGNISRMYAEQSTDVTEAAAGINILGPNAKLHIGQFTNNNSNAQALSVSGANSKVTVSRAQPGTYNRSAVGFPAYQTSASGAEIILGEIIDPGSGGGAELVTSVGGGVVRADVWRSFAPTVVAGAGTITTLGTCTGRYRIVGGTLHWHVNIAITTNGTGAQDVRVTNMPVISASAGSGSGRESQTTGKGLACSIGAASTTLTINNAADNTYPGGDGAKIDVWGNYEVA